VTPPVPGKAAASSPRSSGPPRKRRQAKAKILANKSTSLTTDALLGADGLGFGAIAGQLSDDLGINVCNGLEPIAECLLTSHRRRGRVITGTAAPRTARAVAALPARRSRTRRDYPCSSAAAASAAAARPRNRGEVQ
jgi:hypothetical protein